MRMPVVLLLLAAGGVAAQPVGAPPAVSPDPITVAIAELLNDREPLVLDGRRLDVRALRQVYEPRGYRPVWAGRGDASERGKAIAAALDHAADHGLDPTVYHQQAITRRAAGGRPEDHGALDVLSSDAMMRLVAHLRLGAVGPGAVDKDAAVEPRPLDAQALTLEAAAAPDPMAYLDGLAPHTETYRGLLEALARYREIARDGGWPKVPAKGPVLRPGAKDPSVATIRARLAATGELPPVSEGPSASEGAAAGEGAPACEGAVAGQPTVYDDALVAAVKEFQARHGLAADGIVGPPTRAALAIPVGDRVKQLAANLERLRWFPGELGTRYVAVNVPSFELVVVENGSTVLKMPVVVGRRDRRTPLLSTRITELVFNPSWTVPPTILRADFLPKMRRNASYASRRGLQVVGGSTLRQPPGPRNPLGRVKFLMPNGHAIYLHDTTAKGLMRQPSRALSSGCVRLGDALGLANHLLSDDPRWTPATRKRFLAGWTTRYLALREPVPVYLEYQTAWRDDAGDIQFRDDLYGRDAALSKVLAVESAPPTPATPSA